MTIYIKTPHMKQYIPNILTSARIMGIPFIIILMFIQKTTTDWMAFWLYVMVSVTDFLDGYLSRKWGTVSDLGRFLDPVADKLLVAAVLVSLMINGTLTFNSPNFGTVFGAIGGVMAMGILFREITVSALREYLAEKNIVVPVTPLAKWKTATQMVALGVLILGDQGIMWGGYGILMVSAVLTAITGYTYIRGGISHMLQDKQF